MLNNQKKIIKNALILLLGILIITTIIFLIIKYEIKGENNLPFKISNITLISATDGIKNEDTENKWNINLIQTNDIYFEIIKNPQYKNQEIIKNIIFENFEIIEKNQLGEIKFDIIKKDENGIRKYNNLFEGKVIYNGDKNTDLDFLQINNQGGIIAISANIDELGTYISNEEEIKYDATLLKEKEIIEAQLKSKVQFDIIIELETGIKFRGTTQIEIPSQDLLTKGMSTTKITNENNIIFKRI